jgi:HSP20 family molecular chaperone IbpA
MSKAHRPKEVILNLDQSRRSLKAVPGKNSALSVSSAVSLGEHPGEYLVFVAVPGMERKDFSVTIINKKLEVSSVKKEAWHKLD